MNSVVRKTVVACRNHYVISVTVAHCLAHEERRVTSKRCFLLPGLLLQQPAQRNSLHPTLSSVANFCDYTTATLRSSLSILKLQDTFNSWNTKFSSRLFYSLSLIFSVYYAGLGDERRLDVLKKSISR
jgi:hypothetical protein